MHFHVARRGGGSPLTWASQQVCHVFNVPIKSLKIFLTRSVFWGELIDKYIDINANSKTVFTDYAMLKLVLYSPHMFL